MEKTTESVLEIHLGALEHNYHFLRSKIKPETRFLGVVKAGAYGSDSLAIAKKLKELGADYLAVAYCEEGVYLREHGIDLPMMVLHPLPAHFNRLIQYCLEPCLYAPNMLIQFLEALKENSQQAYPVHLKFNTGLNRLGFWENDLPWLAEKLNGVTSLRLVSVFSHLAASDDLKMDEFTQTQIERFEKIVQQTRDLLHGNPLFHLLNTSGILNYPNAQWDMVRSGIGLHGYSNDPQTDQQLEAVATLKTIISQIHKIEPGETVGYNLGYTAPGYRTIATLPLGHADGIDRIYGQGRGYVWIGDKQAPIIGNVCMDMLMVDITDIPCKEGDEILVFGKKHSAENLAHKAGTISYELLTGIAPRIKRRVIEN